MQVWRASDFVYKVITPLYSKHTLYLYLGLAIAKANWHVSGMSISLNFSQRTPKSDDIITKSQLICSFSQFSQLLHFLNFHQLADCG